VLVEIRVRYTLVKASSWGKDKGKEILSGFRTARSYYSLRLLEKYQGRDVNNGRAGLREKEWGLLNAAFIAE